MSASPGILRICAACLCQQDDITVGGLCERCSLWNDSLDGTLIPLLNLAHQSESATPIINAVLSTGGRGEQN